MLIGSDEINYRSVEAAIGRPVDVIRAYRYKGQNHASLLALAAAGYGVWASYKFRDGSGTVASTAVTSHALDADLDVFDQTMEQLKRGGRGPHRKGYEHEEDAKAAAASGTPAQLNASVTYCIDRRKPQAKAAGLQTFQCWTGFDLLLREPLYRVSGLDVDGYMLDPYELAPTGPWVSLVASYGQDLNYLKATYPNLQFICLGEVNAPNSGGAGMQAAWLNQARHDLEAQFPAVDGACLWQGGNLSETAAELAAMKGGFFAAGTVVDPQIAALQAQVASLVAAGTAKDSQIARMHTAVSAAQTALAGI